MLKAFKLLIPLPIFTTFPTLPGFYFSTIQQKSGPRPLGQSRSFPSIPLQSPPGRYAESWGMDAEGFALDDVPPKGFV